jgi:flavin-dependent thymidylate synthase
MTEHGLTRDVAFNRHSMNDGHHVSPFDNSKIQVGTDGIEVALVQGIHEEDFKRTLSAATRATIGIDIEPKWEPCDMDGDDMRIAHGAYVSDPSVIKCKRHSSHRGDWYTPRSAPWEGMAADPLADNGDWEEMLKGGLQTALESQVIVFAVKGASRTATHQLVRSRRAAFHQQSQRASYMGDYPEVRIPESVWRNMRARKAFIEAVVTAQTAYRTICEEDISYQDARFVLPEGTTNFILLEYPVREFINVYAYRGCSMFQWEIVDIMRKARAALIEAHPWLEPHIKISCEKTGPAKIPVSGAPIETHWDTVEHHCTFQGWEVVEGQCDFPWAKEEARTFKPVHHRIARGGQ